MSNAGSLSPAGTAQRGAPILSGLLARKRTLVMGILNVTPDSFSDGGRLFDAATAIAHARDMVAKGADIIDIGAESTRPYGNAVAVSFEYGLNTNYGNTITAVPASASLKRATRSAFTLTLSL